jgi:GT2 family glycosyltransferase
MNNGDDAARHIVARFPDAAADVRYFHLGQNLGPAGSIASAMSMAVEAAGSDDWFTTIDDDAPPSSQNFLREMLSFADEMRKRDPRTGAVGALGVRFDQRLGLYKRLEDDELHGPVSVDALAGGHVPLIAIAAARTVGTYDPTLFYGHEELEYFLRMKRAGFVIYSNGDLHKRARVASGRLGLRHLRSLEQFDTPWRRYYSTRNLILVLLRERSYLGILSVVGRSLAKVAWASLRGRCSRGAVDSTWAGLCDGLRGRTGRVVDPPLSTTGLPTRPALRTRSE